MVCGAALAFTAFTVANAAICADGSPPHRQSAGVFVQIAVGPVAAQAASLVQISDGSGRRQIPQPANGPGTGTAFGGRTLLFGGAAARGDGLGRAVTAEISRAARAKCRTTWFVSWKLRLADSIIGEWPGGFAGCHSFVFPSTSVADEFLLDEKRVTGKILRICA